MSSSSWTPTKNHFTINQDLWRNPQIKIENLFLSKIRPRGERTPRPASTTVRFVHKFIGPPSESVLEADELSRPASASVRLRQKFIGPPSKSVLEADELPRPASASVRFRPGGGRSRRKSSFRRSSPSDVRLHPRTAVPVPRPLIQNRNWD